jgi:uncharacterized protein (TIGR00730 family)
MSEDLAAVCVFCGSNRGASPRYAQAAREVGRLLAGQGIRLVYGGASEGLMGIVADAALAAGGADDGIYFDDDPSRLLRRLAECESPDVHKWIDRDVAL